MNPNRWHWYTWFTLFVIAVELLVAAMMMYSGFYPTLFAVPWLGLAFSTFMMWGFLAVMHMIVVSLVKKS